MVYCHIDLNRGTAVPMTASDVGLVFGLPHTRRTLNLPRDKIMRRGSLPSMRFKYRWLKVRMRMTSVESISGHVNWGQFLLYHLIDGVNHFRQHGESYVIVARMEVTGLQLKATQAQMNNLIIAYGHDLIALKSLQPSPSIPVDEDFQPFENMADVVEPVVERLVDEATVEADDDGGPSNHVSPREQDDSDTS
ncbi:hypothetical protein AAG906_021495 [Vitis piasezkii]